jgi:hypothetical protein
MTVTGFELSDLFDRARAAPESAASGLRTTLSEDLAGLDQVDQTELDRSLRLKLALDGMKARAVSMPSPSDAGPKPSPNMAARSAVRPR